MATGTILKQTFVIKGVNANPKYGKGAVLVEEAGQEVWLNFSDKTDFPIRDIDKGGTYTFEIYKADSGKKYINKVLDTDGSEVKAEVAAPKKASSTSATYKGKSTYVDNSKGQRQGALGHYASRITAALITTGIVADADKAVETFNHLYAEFDKVLGK